MPACARCGKDHRKPTVKRRRFAELYLKYLDAQRAAREAGYKETSAKQQGYELLHEDSVQCMLRVLAEEQSKRIAIESDQILGGLMRIATFDPIEIFNDNGTLKKLSEIPPEVRRAIAAMKWKDGKLEEFKLPDKVRSFELLGKHKRLFADVQVHEGEITLRERVARGRRRARLQGDDK